MQGERVHIRSRGFPDRMICGRRDSGLRTVAREAAERVMDLCSKCRQELWFANLLEAASREPLRAGYQYSLWENRAALERRKKGA